MLAIPQFGSTAFGPFRDADPKDPLFGRLTIAVRSSMKLGYRDRLFSGTGRIGARDPRIWTGIVCEEHGAEEWMAEAVGEPICPHCYHEPLADTGLAMPLMWKGRAILDGVTRLLHVMEYPTAFHQMETLWALGWSTYGSRERLVAIRRLGDIVTYAERQCGFEAIIADGIAMPRDRVEV